MVSYDRSLSSAAKLDLDATLGSPCYSPEGMEDKTLTQVTEMC